MLPLMHFFMRRMSVSSALCGFTTHGIRLVEGDETVEAENKLSGLKESERKTKVSNAALLRSHAS